VPEGGVGIEVMNWLSWVHIVAKWFLHAETTINTQMAIPKKAFAWQNAYGFINVMTCYSETYNSSVNPARGESPVLTLHSLRHVAPHRMTFPVCEHDWDQTNTHK
jgi:hypothetical protein